MKIYWLLVCLICCTAAIGQPRKIDSLSAALRLEKTDTGRVTLLWNLCEAYEVYKPDSALLFGQEALLLARKIKYTEGESRALDHMADAFGRVGDYPKALEYYIEKLKIDEKTKSYYGMAVANINIASLYQEQGDYKKALFYESVADSIIKLHNDSYLQMFNFVNKGDMYEKNNQLDSAVLYTINGYNAAANKPDTFMMGSALNNLGNIYVKMDSSELAFKYYRLGLPFLIASNNQNFLCETNLGLARLFLKAARVDSAIFYGKLAFNIAVKSNFQSNLLNASRFLTEVYKKSGSVQNAFNYLQVMINVKDSIESAERIKKLQIISIDEQLRQKELAELLRQENEERIEKMQWLGIGILIPVLFLFSIFLSKRKVHKKIIEFSGIVSLLLLFEYLTLLLHPIVASTTHHSPALEIIIFVCIAAIITPTHHRIEHWLIHKLTEINFHKHHKTIVEVLPNNGNLDAPPDNC